MYTKPKLEYLLDSEFNDLLTISMFGGVKFESFSTNNFHI